MKARPLRPLELIAVRVVAMYRADVTAVVGAGVALCSTAELPRLRPEHLRISAAGLELHLPGAEHRRGPSAAVPRVAVVPTWCEQAFRERVALTEQHPGRPLLYDGDVEDKSVVMDRILERQQWVLERIGLKGDPTALPLSIRNGVALQLYETTNSIARVAQAMGLPANSCARSIGITPPLPRRPKKLPTA